jgi:hypothetical protein
MGHALELPLETIEKELPINMQQPLLMQMCQHYPNEKCAISHHRSPVHVSVFKSAQASVLCVRRVCVVASERTKWTSTDGSCGP